MLSNAYNQREEKPAGIAIKVDFCNYNIITLFIIKISLLYCIKIFHSLSHILLPRENDGGGGDAEKACEN